MAETSNSTVYIGNLDERVSDRMLYDILIQAGRVVDLYIPRHKETDKLKGFAFAAYESEEAAEYAVKLFSGLVIPYKKTLKFAISGTYKSSVSQPTATPSAVSSSLKPRQYHKNTEPHSKYQRISGSCRFSEHRTNYQQDLHDKSFERSNVYRSYHDSRDYNCRRKVFRSVLGSIDDASSMWDSMNRKPYYGMDRDRIW